MREEIRKHEAAIKILEEQKYSIEAFLLETMDAAGIDQARGQRATITKSPRDVPLVKDWDKFYAYIYKAKAFHLLERRAARAAWSEEVESRKGKPLPGVEAFKKVSLNMRSL